MTATTKSSSSSKDSPVDSVFLALGHMYDLMGQMGNALGIYNSIIKRNPVCVKALYSRGLILLWKSQDDLAMRDLHKAVATASKDRVALRNRALGYIFAENMEAAVKDLSKSLESREWDAITCIVAYCAFMKQGMHEEANNVLANAEGRIPGQEWPLPILQYLQGSLEMTSLMTIANASKGKLLEARCYLGFIKSLGANPPEGKPDLMFVRDSDTGSALVRVMATRQLKILEQGMDEAMQRRAENNDRIQSMDWM